METPVTSPADARWLSSLVRVYNQAEGKMKDSDAAADRTTSGAWPAAASKDFRQMRIERDGPARSPGRLLPRTLLINSRIGTVAGCQPHAPPFTRSVKFNCFYPRFRFESINRSGSINNGLTAGATDITQKAFGTRPRSNKCISG